MWDTVVKEIIGQDKAEQLLIENVKTGDRQIIPTEGVFVLIGHHPNTAVLDGQVKLTQYGTIAVDERMQTSVEGVFAAGEIADPHFRQVVTSAGMGAAAAISATHYLETLKP